MAKPVGLVVEPVVLNRLGIFPESATTVLADWQQRLEQLLEDQPVGDQAASEQRLERLLKESEHPIGLLWNGVALRLVYAPRGESSGHLSFPLEPMTTVDGRPMLAALQMLLGPDTWVVTPSAQLTVASSRELPGLNGAMAVKVPRANGPTLVGAAGPLSIASDCRKLLEKRWLLRQSVSPFCRAALKNAHSGGPHPGRMADAGGTAQGEAPACLSSTSPPRTICPGRMGMSPMCCS